MGDRDGLARAIRSHPADASGWVRGVGYFESVAGALDRTALDAIEPRRPLRVQHRTGQLWMLNTAALERLDAALEHPTGRLFRADRWLRERIGASTPPCLAALSTRLWDAGVSRVTDATHTNDAAQVAAFAAARSRGELRQELVVMGTLALSAVEPPPGIEIGPVKIHLAEAALPALDDVIATIRAAHGQCRNAALHAVTRIEALYAVAAYEAAGVRRGDRIEHLHVAPPECIEAVARLGLTVCTNPALIAARRSRWHADLAPADLADLLDEGVLRRAGIPLLHGSDAPYGPLSACCPVPNAASDPVAPS